MSTDHNNHRQIMLTAATATGRPHQLVFMKLPHELQDEIVEKIDQRMLTFKRAEKVCKERGYPICHEAIRHYYKALTQARRAYEANNALVAAVRGFENFTTEESLRGLLKLMAGITAQGLLEGKIAVKDVDVAKLTTSLMEALESSSVRTGAQKKGETDLSPETKEHIRKQVYGI